MSVNLPGLLHEQLVAAREAGFYASEEEMIADGIRMLLAARPDVRLAAACWLYARGTVSLGKAAELAGVDVVSIKNALGELGIARTAPEGLAETEDMARKSLRAGGRST
jgi:predicted HTH domain antitoxin